jgi:hypothetical protein
MQSKKSVCALVKGLVAASLIFAASFVAKPSSAQCVLRQVGFGPGFSWTVTNVSGVFVTCHVEVQSTASGQLFVSPEFNNLAPGQTAGPYTAPVVGPVVWSIRYP